MRRAKDNKWLDDALTEAIGGEKPDTSFETWKRNHPEAIEMLTSRVDGRPPVPTRPLNIGRIIMKNHMTRLAAAAVIIAAAVLSITVFIQPTNTAYAIGQTIEAMRRIGTVHALCTDWDGSKVEAWAELNPETGKEDAIYTNVPAQGQLLISTAAGTYYYDTKRNVVRVDKGLAPASEVRLAHFVEDTVDYVTRHNGKLKIRNEYDQEEGRKVIVVYGVTDKQEFEVRIDPATKLPICLNMIRNEYPPGGGLKSIDEIYYDEAPPPGIFDFRIPEGAEVVIHRAQPAKVLDDADAGMVVEGEAEEACQRIVAEYWQAVIAQDWQKARKLRPMPEKCWEYLETRDYVDNKPAKLIKLEEPYHDEICWIGPITPYVIRMSDGQFKTGNMIVKFRETSGVRSCVIAGAWGREWNVME